MLSKPNFSSHALKQKIEFIDLKAQQLRIREKLDNSIKKVLDHGIYIMGPEVAQLEKELSEFCGVKHSISCANGTDALGLFLMAINVGPGDAVFVPSFTFAATAEVVAWVGATPIFIDSLPDTYNIDPSSLEQGINLAKNLGLKPSGIIPVDLFGQPVDYDQIEFIAEKFGLWIMSDGAQSFGAYYKGRRTGNIGTVATTSFFPAKPLGCYGDGGAIFTNDDELASKIKSLRVHGQGIDKYDNIRIGINGRLDTIQAAILIEKLKIFEDEIVARQKVADYYTKNLCDDLKKPLVLEGASSVWAQYTIELPENIDRTKLMSQCKEVGIPTIIYYVKPLHLQTIYKQYPIANEKGLSVCEKLANHVLSLPMHPYLSENEQKYIVENINNIILSEM